jgi:hypothetical protein
LKIEKEVQEMYGNYREGETLSSKEIQQENENKKINWSLIISSLALGFQRSLF